MSTPESLLDEALPPPGALPKPTPSAENDGAEDEPSADESTKALISRWTGKVQAAKRFHRDSFKRMRENAAFVRGKQWLGDKKEGEPKSDDHRYVANITLRHVATKVAALYAKNPRAVATRRKTLDYPTWDGTQSAMMQAIQQINALSTASAANPMAMADPSAQAQLSSAKSLLEEIAAGLDRRKQLDRVGKTLEIAYEYEVREQIPPFKQQMKQLVRRVVVTGVGYLKLGYHRFKEARPEDVSRVQDMTDQLAHAQRLAEEVREGEVTDPSADIAELKSALQVLQDPNAPQYINEGLDFDFPQSTAVIIDPACRNLLGFIGAQWVAQEFLLTPDQIEEIYGIDVGRQFTAYTPDDLSPAHATQGAADASDGKAHVCVWEIYDKQTRSYFTIAEGYPGYLKSPAAPVISLERFWPFFVLTFNDTEDETCIFPPSDVDLIRPMQREHNLSRQRLIEHRDAARPKHVIPAGSLLDKDKTALTESAAHTVVELSGLAPGQKISDILQPVPHNGVDPNLYETNSTFEDSLKVLGAQEANLGGTSGVTATESSIAESSRLSAIGSNADDLDDFLTDVARNASQVMLALMTKEAITEIVGPGAVWPSLSRNDIAKELWLEVKAGSSGRPNKAMEIQNLERLLPFMLQIPGIDPQWLATHLLERYDERIDPSDAIAASLPSIIAMNSGPSALTPAGPIPAAQGANGASGPAAAPAPVSGDTNMGPNTAVSAPTGNLPPAPNPPVAPVAPAAPG